MKSVDSSFISQGVRCAGTLHQPDRGTTPPVIVMAHGFGAIRAAGLMPFAKRFVAAGYAVYLFDYRGFGDSDGEPRQWISPRRHLRDWKAAIAHVRSLPQIDARRIVLWGTSFSGGHVLQTTAGDEGVRAVIAQVPHVSGLASVGNLPPLTLAKLTAAGLRDLVGGWFGRPFYRPIVGHPGDAAGLTSAECWDGYMGIMPKDARWENTARAQAFLETPLYSPIRHAHRIKAPTLVIAGRDDSVTPASAARSAAKRIPKGRFELLESNHFQPYVGDTFEKNIALQLAFLDEVLLARQKSKSR
jgi:pimeloyl-ACP methyl ester carboxylesterase